MLPNDSIREGIFQATPVFLRNQGKYIVAYTTHMIHIVPFIVCTLLHNGMILFLKSIRVFTKNNSI